MHFSYTRNTSFLGKFVPSICLGTAEPADASNDPVNLMESIRYAVQKGIKVIDTASNYYEGQAEQWIGEAMSYFEDIDREEYTLVSKAGQLSNEEIVSSQYKSRLSQGQYWCFDKAYIESSLNRSLRRLKVSKLDCLLLHNPEVAISGPGFIEYFKDLFTLLEKKCAEGVIGCWGISTWHGLLGGQVHRHALQLHELMDFLHKHHGNHHFRVLQVPSGIWNMAEHGINNQYIPDGSKRLVTVSEAARALGIDMMFSSPFNGGLNRPIISQHLSLSASQSTLLDLFEMEPGLRVVGMRSFTSINEALALL